MSFIKAQLKAARDALGSKSFEYAKSCCESILENDDQNYNALVFLGLAESELGNPVGAQASYEKAIQIAPQNLSAYQVLAFDIGLIEIV